MAIAVIDAQHSVKKSGKFTFVTLAGVPWGIFSISFSKKATVIKAEQLQRNSSTLRFRVVRVVPKRFLGQRRSGREWAIVVRKK